MSDPEGFHRAVVFDAADPAGLRRARLQVPSLMGNIPTGWAEPAVSGTVVTAGDRAWVTFEGGDLNKPVYMLGDNSREVYLNRASMVMRGGGRRYVSNSGASWSYPFYTRGAGRNKYQPGAFFWASMPAVGTVIQKAGTTSSTVTVTADTAYENRVGSYVPMLTGESLWYELPLGRTFNTVGTYWITPSSAYNFDFVPPDNWILIVSRMIAYPTSDQCGYVWGDGRESTQWTAPTLQNSWVNYDPGPDIQHNNAGWKKEYGWVNWKGLIRSGVTTAGTLIAPTDPAYNGNLNGTQSNGRDLFVCNGDVVARVDAQPIGLYFISGSNGYLSLATIRYWNG